MSRLDSPQVGVVKVDEVLVLSMTPYSSSKAWTPALNPHFLCLLRFPVMCGVSGSWCDPSIGSIAGQSELTDGKPEPESPAENFYHIPPLTDSERTATPRPPPGLYLPD
eukprot:superscaffoldBa00007321_g22420